MSTFQLYPLVPYWISALISLSVSVFSWSRKNFIGSRTYAIIALSQSLWTIGYIFELASVSLKEKIFWDNAQFITMFITVGGFVIFAMVYAEIRKPKALWVGLGLGIFSLISLALIYTDPLHGWIRSDTTLEPGSPFDTLTYHYKPLLWVIFISIYSLNLVVYPILISKLHRDPPNFKVQTWIILLGITIPAIGSFPALLDLPVPFQRDTTPLTFAIANLVIAWGLFRYRLFDIHTLARDSIVEYMRDGVILLDMAGRVIEANPAAATIFGKPPATIRDQKISSAFSGWPVFINLLENNLNTSNPLITTLSFDQNRYFEIEIRIVYRRKSFVAGKLVTLHEITEHIKLVETLQLRTLELETSNQELESFAYSVAHNLRAPLRAMNGFSHILMDDYHDSISDDGQSLLTRIQSASHQMATLIDDLLMLSKATRQELVFNHINLSEAASTIATQFSKTDPNRKVTFKIDPDINTIGDPALLDIVLENLISNAWKFTRDQPSATIEFGQKEIDGFPAFYVKDNGVGFDMNFSDKLFQPFQRLHSPGEFEGSGIGLAIAERIVHRHRGRIWGIGIPGKGATFYFSLENSHFYQ